ncbi:hypothetical protein ApAK_04710 [Thermoplasmatales archaeon AK]|nr:hypothetical protein [Thermoplasmatales archaeon AK]
MPLLGVVYAPNSPTLIGDLGVKHFSTEEALGKLGSQFADLVETVIVVSPHFVTSGAFGVVAEPNPKQIYDFSGFPPEFYQIKYEPPGDEELGKLLINKLLESGIPAGSPEGWGLDHGAWSPLKLMFPMGDKKVLPVSIAPNLGSDAHFRLGQIISGVSHEKNILLLVTGSIIHRLDLWVKGSQRVPDKAVRYLNEVTGYMVAGLWDQIWHVPRDLYRAAAPEGGEFPLRILAGTIGNQYKGRILSNELEFGAVSLTTVLFAAEGK